WRKNRPASCNVIEPGRWRRRPEARIGAIVNRLTFVSNIVGFNGSRCEALMIKPLELHPKLHGVDHTARPTWKLRETVHFYRDILGLPLVHCISAKGWGREKGKHADFLHFFFDSGNESTIAFFYYVGTQQPPELVVSKGYMAMANHTAWRVESEAELLDWQRRLESHGVNVSQFVQHEIIESIYFRD